MTSNDAPPHTDVPGPTNERMNLGRLDCILLAIFRDRGALVIPTRGGG